MNIRKKRSRRVTYGYWFSVITSALIAYNSYGGIIKSDSLVAKNDSLDIVIQWVQSDSVLNGMGTFGSGLMMPSSMNAPKGKCYLMLRVNLTNLTLEEKSISTSRVIMKVGKSEASFIATCAPGDVPIFSQKMGSDVDLNVEQKGTNDFVLIYLVPIGEKRGFLKFADLPIIEIKIPPI